MNESSPLTEGWPDEPGRDDVEQFAIELQARLPQLPDPALQRIEARLQAAMKPPPFWKRRHWQAAAALAACLLIGVGIYSTNNSVKSTFSNEAAKATSGGEPRVTPLVSDTYRVPAVIVPAPTPSDQPLIAFDGYESLFRN